MPPNIGTKHSLPYANHLLSYTVYDQPKRTTTSPKTTLVFLHGWTCASSLWLPSCLPLLEDPSYRSILIDLPGHGESTAVEGTDYCTEFFVSAVTTILSECRIISNVVLIGHSYGGIVSTYVLKLNPTLVSGIIYVDSFFFMGTQYMSQKDRKANGASMSDMSHFLGTFESILCTARTTPKLRKRINDVISITPLHVRVSTLTTDMLPPPWKVDEVFENLPALTIIALPWAKPDAHLGWKHALPKIEEDDWNADLDVKDHWSHFMFMENPERFVTSIETFLTKHALK